MAVLHSGRLPNVFWQAQQFDQLQQDPCFEALPPAERVFVRQEDALWGRLHEGVLSTGRLAAALGLYERSAAKRLGLKSSRRGAGGASHAEQLAAYQHLLAPPSAPATNPSIGAQAACEHNARLQRAFNEAKQQQQASPAGGAAPAPAATAGGEAVLTPPPSRPGSAVSLGSVASSREQQDAEPPTGQEAEEGADAAGVREAIEGDANLPTVPPAQKAAGSSHLSRRRRAQELKSSAEALFEAVPGAPPDSAAAAAATGATAAAGGGKERRRKKRESGSSGPGTVPAAGAAQPAAPTAAQLLAAPPPGAVAAAQGAGPGWSEEWKLRKARALAQLGLPSICCAWGNAQEATALRAVQGIFPLAGLVEVGLCRIEPERLEQEWGFTPGSLPPLGASPDALLRHKRRRPSASSGAGDDSTPSCAPGEVQLAEQLEGLALGAAPAASASSNGDGAGCPKNESAMASTSSSNIAVQEDEGEWWMEVVEVKNSCPFGFQMERRARGPRGLRYCLHDRGPRPAVAPEWVPQLQLHMLCAGTRSGLLVSRSATKGIRVFRMPRDDAYVRLMLAVLARLWRDHVLPQRPPPAEAWASWAEHHRLLSATAALAAGAAQVATAESATYHPPGGDPRFFLD
eukprot:scaffold17.g528.t1